MPQLTPGKRQCSCPAWKGTPQHRGTSSHWWSSLFSLDQGWTRGWAELSVKDLVPGNGVAGAAEAALSTTGTFSAVLQENWCQLMWHMQPGRKEL